MSAGMRSGQSDLDASLAPDNALVLLLFTCLEEYLYISSVNWFDEKEQASARQDSFLDIPALLYGRQADLEHNSHISQKRAERILARPVV